MIPFSPPHIYPEAIEEVTEVLQSGWITTGPKTKQFEEELTAYNGNSKTLCVSSATHGMELVLDWFGVGPGDEVIVPAYTYCATANVVLRKGATPVMVDINESDFNISVDAVRKAITGRTKVIIPVDIGGWPCDYEELYGLVREEEVKEEFRPKTPEQEQLGRVLVLSDAAHSLGAENKEKRTGGLADMTVFSFHAVKNLTTSEGGAIAFHLPAPFDPEEVYKRLNVRSLHGQSKDALAKSKKGGWRYDVEELGYKCNMTDIQAAIGRVALNHYEENLARRKVIMDTYKSAFEKDERFEVPVYETESRVSSFHLFMLRLPGASEEMRDQVIEKVFEQEVSVNVHFLPLPELTLYKKLGYEIVDYPNAKKRSSTEITLPVYYDLMEDQVQTVIQAVKNAVEEVNVPAP